METFLTDILFSEYPNDSGYYGSGDTEVDCYDDEDCVTEGSGSGGKVRGHEDSEDGEGSGGYGEDEDEDEDSFDLTSISCFSVDHLKATEENRFHNLYSTPVT